MNPELPLEHLCPELGLDDVKLLEEIFAKLSKAVDNLADPYSEDGSYVVALSGLPVGLRSMAATHHLDVSLTMDDIGWHFLNFGEPGLVRATEAGLKELGPTDVADWFAEAFSIVNPVKPQIGAAADCYDVLTENGKMDRIEELTDLASEKKPTVSGSPIYGAWVVYTRKYPERVLWRTKEGVSNSRGRRIASPFEQARKFLDAPAQLLRIDCGES